MSCCVAQTHTVVPQKKDVAFLQHPLSISPFLSLLNLETLPPPLNPSEGVWTSLNTLKPLNLFDGLWPHWSHWRPLKCLWTHWTDRTPEHLSSDSNGPCAECSQICQLIARRCSGYLVVYVQWSMPATEATRLLYLLVYDALASLSTENGVILSITLCKRPPPQHIVA